MSRSLTERVRQRTHLRPLTLAAVGLALVALDTRLRALDLLPDPIGWLLVALGAASLARGAAARWAVLAAALSLADVVLPYQLVAVDPSSGKVVSSAADSVSLPTQVRWDAISDPHALLMAAGVVSGGLAVATLLTGLAARASQAGRRDDAGLLRLATGAALVVWAVPFTTVMLVAVVGRDRYDPVWNGALEYLGLAAALALVLVAVALVRLRDETWAVPEHVVRASRWEGNPFLAAGLDGPARRP